MDDKSKAGIQPYAASTVVVLLLRRSGGSLDELMNAFKYGFLLGDHEVALLHMMPILNNMLSP